MAKNESHYPLCTKEGSSAGTVTLVGGHVHRASLRMKHGQSRDYLKISSTINASACLSCTPTRQLWNFYFLCKVNNWSTHLWPLFKIASWVSNPLYLEDYTCVLSIQNWRQKTSLFDIFHSVNARNKSLCVPYELLQSRMDIAWRDATKERGNNLIWPSSGKNKEVHSHVTDVILSIVTLLNVSYKKEKNGKRCIIDSQINEMVIRQQ